VVCERDISSRLAFVGWIRHRIGLKSEGVLSRKNIKKSILCLGVIAILGYAYILGYVFPRLAHYEAENAVAAKHGPTAARPCLELTSDTGTVRDGYGRIHGWVRNNCEKRYNYVEVEYKLYDAGGEVVGGAMTNLAVLGPHESWRFEAVAMQPYARYELAHVAGD
jgi:hypothetical protein